MVLPLIVTGIIFVGIVGSLRCVINQKLEQSGNWFEFYNCSGFIIKAVCCNVAEKSPDYTKYH